MKVKGVGVVAGRMRANQGGEAKEPWYGNFTGPGSDANPYRLLNGSGRLLTPINEVDRASQGHDFGYWKKGVTGFSGALFSHAVAVDDLTLSLLATGVLLEA